MKIYRVCGKSWKDKIKNQSVTLYHISPNKLNILMPRSKLLRTGRIGLFLSPSYKSTIQDWASYVRGKKHKKHPLQSTRGALWDELDKLEKLTGDQITPEIQSRIEQINDRLDKTKEAFNSDEYSESIEGYKTLYLHSIQCPKEIYEESLKRMDEAYENDPNKSLGFWGWGAQVFVDAEFLKQLKIINIQEFNVSQLLDEMKHMDFKRYLEYPSQNSVRYWERYQKEQKDKATS